MTRRPIFQPTAPTPPPWVRDDPGVVLLDHEPSRDTTPWLRFLIQNDEEGHLAIVSYAAMPAHFYTVTWTDGQGTHRLATGSGPDMKELACRIAKALSEGMLDLE